MKKLLFKVGSEQITVWVKRIRKRKFGEEHYRLRFDPLTRSCHLHISGSTSESGVGIILNRHRRWLMNRLYEGEDTSFLVQWRNLVSKQQLPLLDETIALKIHQNAAQLFCEQRDHQLHVGIPENKNLQLFYVVRAWYKQQALQYLHEHLPVLAAKMGVYFNQIRVKDQKTLWGSCSGKGNLNFNWRMMWLSEKEAEYLMIHELAHLRHMNHSRSFWVFVERFCPDYRIYRKQLRNKNGFLRVREELFSE